MSLLTYKLVFAIIDIRKKEIKMEALSERIKNGSISKEELINKIAFAFHYEGWYKDTIEGKFGLKTDGADHGRFKASKNATLDQEFFAAKEFNDDGYSLETDKNGNPLYKREQVNGGFKYYVDSAIKGWNFLPPSWKQENSSAAEIVLNHLEHCENEGMSISRYLPAISVIIHKWWVARQIAGEFGIDTTEARLLGTLSNDDVKYIKGEAAKPKKPSMLLKNLLNVTTKERLNEIWGIENFVSYDELPFEEQIKDTNQVKYALNAINKATNNQIDYYLDQEMLVIDKINQMQMQNNKNQVQDN